MSYDHIRTRRDEAALVITLDRPEKRNALSLDMRKELVAAIRAADADPEVNAIILTGAGAGFCAGADLAESTGIERLSMETRRHRLGVLQDITRAIVQSPKAVIAAVHGSAYGAGLSIAAACDYVVAADNARFCAIFCRLGLLPDAGILWSLPRRASYGATRKLLMTGEPMGAEEAVASGVADELTDQAGMLPAALAFARACGLAAPLSLRSIKQALATELTTLDAVFDYEAEVQFALGDSEDTAEAKAAFFAKRKPRFLGR